MVFFGYPLLFLALFSLSACAVPASVRFEDNEDISVSSTGPASNPQPENDSSAGQAIPQQSGGGMNSANMQQSMQQQMMQQMQKNMMSGGMSSGMSGGMSKGSGMNMGGGGGMGGGMMPGVNANGGMTSMPMILDNNEMPGRQTSDSGPDGSVMQEGSVGTLGGGPPANISGPESMPSAGMPSAGMPTPPSGGTSGGGGRPGGGPESVIKGGSVGSLGGGPPQEFQ